MCNRERARYTLTVYLYKYLAMQYDFDIEQYMECIYAVRVSVPFDFNGFRLFL